MPRPILAPALSRAAVGDGDVEGDDVGDALGSATVRLGEVGETFTAAVVVSVVDVVFVIPINEDAPPEKVSFGINVTCVGSAPLTPGQLNPSCSSNALSAYARSTAGWFLNVYEKGPV